MWFVGQVLKDTVDGKQTCMGTAPLGNMKLKWL